MVGVATNRSMALRRRKKRGMRAVVIGVILLFLGMGYLIMILYVARSSLSSSQQEANEKNNAPMKTTKQIAQDSPKNKKDPVRRHHLELEFGAGVEPDHLVELDPKDAPILYMDDPHIQQHPTPENVLQAYLEPLNYDDWKIQPLPLRQTAKADQLKKISYTRLSSCSKLTQQWPMDDPPTDDDPFLPWIHDVFPTADGKYIQFVAQNKRRCRTGSKEKDILAHMAPQASLFQHVSVKRVEDGRYRLASHDDADPDAMATRFICRFKPSMEETLSVYNFDYDWASYRKHYKVSFAEDDGGIKQIHTTQLIFRCPVPESLQERIRTGETVHDDWASLFVDLIPIRTGPRWGPPNQYLVPQYAEFNDQSPAVRFDPDQVWGKEHILPRIEDSGRWENIPICKPSLMTYGPYDENEDSENAVVSPDEPLKKHRLVSCLWASSGYATRGNRFAINDGQRRLLEWVSYNSILGFDHFYVYDNSGAFSAESSLKPIVDLFPGKITYIPWPAKICNNNPNNVDSVGERSSQYAAESSCRLRFGPHVDWIGQFDIDEYLVPMGKHNNVTSLLDELEEEGTKIVSFGSWRAWPRWKFVETPEPINDKEVCWSNEPCFDLRVPLSNTMLQAYNCDRQKPGEKTSTMPAEKQLYTADYVLQHFVHYSAVTQLSEKNRTEYIKEGFRWKNRAFPDPRQRFANEKEEGLMIHTKAVARQDTAGWERACSIESKKLPKRQQGLCRLGIPWPEDTSQQNENNATDDGWAYNCYVNQKVEEFFVPKLKEKLAKWAHFFDKV